MKISKKLFLFLCVVIITCSLSSAAVAYDNSDEYILNIYHIDVKVNENNILDITERIGAYFKIQKHGIFRKIPEKNKSSFFLLLFTFINSIIIKLLFYNKQKEQ